jgi:hypothetical protein
MTSKYAESLKLMKTQMDLIEATAETKHKGTIFKQLQKLGEDIDRYGEAQATKFIHLHEAMAKTFETLGAEVDADSMSFELDGIIYHYSVSLDKKAKK